MVDMETLTPRQRTTKINVLPHVDNQGEPCQHCSVIGRVIGANLYTDPSAEALLLESCVSCIPALMAEYDIIEIELTRALTVAPF